MKLWHKLLILLVAMLIASFLGGKLWFVAFNFAIPSYLAGVIGGATAIPVWELLRWMGRKYPGTHTLPEAPSPSRGGLG